MVSICSGGTRGLIEVRVVSIYSGSWTRIGGKVVSIFSGTRGLIGGRVVSIYSGTRTHIGDQALSIYSEQGISIWWRRSHATVRSILKLSYDHMLMFCNLTVYIQSYDNTSRWFLFEIN